MVLHRALLGPSLGLCSWRALQCNLTGHAPHFLLHRHMAVCQPRHGMRRHHVVRTCPTTMVTAATASAAVATSLGLIVVGVCIA